MFWGGKKTPNKSQKSTDPITSYASYSEHTYTVCCIARVKSSCLLCNLCFVNAELKKCVPLRNKFTIKVLLKREEEKNKGNCFLKLVPGQKGHTELYIITCQPSC